jgi:putative membrane protein
MVRAIIRAGLAILGNAIGLLVAATVLDNMSLTASGFIFAVLIFTAVELIALPLVRKLTDSKAQALSGGTALAGTFIALLVTELVSDGLSISGTATWLYATLIVWLVTMFAGWLLPLIFLKRTVEDRR